VGKVLNHKVETTAFAEYIPKDLVGMVLNNTKENNNE